MLHLRLMTPRDVPLGMRLKEQAGWNQTEVDGRRCPAFGNDALPGLLSNRSHAVSCWSRAPAAFSWTIPTMSR
jgi:hypothetical protein